ncbi:MAG TPA: Ser-Thr-rich GPI-anchored membrane family protein [Blastocatellia bacterium]|nr:Ser-Thr-rich GPI-anchored membrane family protein [Blastocatellia bacterium]
MPQTKTAIRLSLTAGALCLGMIVAMIFPVVAHPFKRAGTHVGAASRQTTLDGVWSVIPDRDFQIRSAGVPNAGWVDNQVWLIASTPSGPRLFRSEIGNNDSQPETVAGLSSALGGTGFNPVEPIPREAPDGTNEIFVAGTAGQNQRSVLFRLRDNGSGVFVRSPLTPVYEAPGERINVPDVYQMNDGRLGLVYIENFSLRGNSQIAHSTDGGASFVFEYNNPFGDHDIANPDAGNTNVDPAVLRLKSDSFIAVTMRQTKLHIFTSADGLHFVPTSTPPIEGATLLPGGQGLFDPTLVELPDGTIMMYVTVGTGPSSNDSSIIRAALVPPSNTAGPFVEIISPNGGEKAKRGKTFTITWSASNTSGIASQDIHLSTDGGATFSTTISTNLSADTRSFDWLVPVELERGKVYRVRLTARDSTGNTGSDASDSNFKIK